MRHMYVVSHLVLQVHLGLTEIEEHVYNIDMTLTAGPDEGSHAILIMNKWARDIT